MPNKRNNKNYKGKLPLSSYSELTTFQLYKNSESTIFKKSITERTKLLGNFTYKGFEYVYHTGKDKNVYVFVTLYFTISGATYKSVRNSYLLAVKLPFLHNMHKMKDLLDLPVQLFSSDPSFYFYFSYALNVRNSVIIDNKRFKDHLGVSLTKKPKRNNKNLDVELTKHFYKVIRFLKGRKPSEYLLDKFLINLNQIRIPNEKSFKKLSKKR